MLVETRRGTTNPNDDDDVQVLRDFFEPGVLSLQPQPAARVTPHSVTHQIHVTTLFSSRSANIK